MKTHESEEMYLETILRLRERKSSVRSIDLAEELGYAKSSVSRAVNLMKEKRYISIDSNGELLLTEIGFAKASSIFERHQLITELLIKMGAEPLMAEENACRIEHVISEELFLILKKFAKDYQK